MSQRLQASVLRPLARVIGGEPEEARGPDEQPALGELAVRATTLRACAGAPPELLEATAALQSIALHAAEREGADAGPPGSRVSALAAPEEEDDDARPVALPAADAPVHFEEHIKPLFRARDRNSMRFALDLWSHRDVADHADAILERLRNGTMPCDGPWPPDRIDVFHRWASSGKAR